MSLEELGAAFYMRRQIVPGALMLPMRLPGLRLFALASLYDEASGLNCWGEPRFAPHGTPTSSIATTWPGVLVPYVEFGSEAAYYTLIDSATSPTGDVTVGGWFYSDTVTVQGGIINKWYTTTSNDRSYALSVAAGGALTFEVSSDGSALSGKLLTVTGPTVAMGQWYFGVGRIRCNSTQGACLDNVWTTVSAAVPTAVYDNSRSLYLGRYNESATTWFDGRIAQLWLCGYAVPDAWIAWLWENQAPYFGR